MKLRSIAITAVLVATVSLSACDFSGFDGLEDRIKLGVVLPEVVTTAGFQILDEQGTPLQKDIKVTVHGPNASDVVDGILFEDFSGSVISNGFAEIAIHDESPQPSEAAPVRFNLVAEDPEGEYITTGLTVKMDSTGRHDLVLRMVKATGSSVSGVSSVQVTSGSTDSNGTTSESIEVTTPTENASGGAVRVNIPSGTRITTADGQPLQGELTTTMAYYSSQTADALQSFPGGLSNLQVETENGTEDAGFISAGFTSIEIRDASGRKARSFDQDIEIDMSVAQNTMNPDTGEPVREGDVIPVWSYEPETGTWTAEGEITVQGITSGKRSVGTTGLTASFSASHLSYYNLDWFVSYPSGTCTYSDGGLTLNITGNDRRLPLLLRLPNNAGWGYYRDRTIWGGDTRPTFYNFPTSLKDIEVAAFYQGQKVGSVTIGDPCGAEVDLPITTPASTQYVDLDFTLEVECDGSQVLLNYYFYYRPVGSWWWSTGYLREGKAYLTGLVYNGTYEVGASFYDSSERRWRFESRQVALDRELDEDNVVRVVETFSDADPEYPSMAEVCEEITG